MLYSCILFVSFFKMKTCYHSFLTRHQAVWRRNFFKLSELDMHNLIAIMSRCEQFTMSRVIIIRQIRQSFHMPTCRIHRFDTRSKLKSNACQEILHTTSFILTLRIWTTRDSLCFFSIPLATYDGLCDVKANIMVLMILWNVADWCGCCEPRTEAKVKAKIWKINDCHQEPMTIQKNLIGSTQLDKEELWWPATWGRGRTKRLRIGRIQLHRLYLA